MTTTDTGRVDPLASGVRGVLFDVDGTLYPQGPLRLLMAAELALEAARAPWRTRRAARILSVFRRVREELRGEGDAQNKSLDALQYERPAAVLGESSAEIASVVDEWMMRRPLKHLGRVRRHGLRELLQVLTERGIRIGALSDYPTDAKLDALGVAEFFSLGLSTTDPAINAFKPHPKGFRHACLQWGLSPQEVLYVGDRQEVDGNGAAAAGIRCAIIGRGGLADLQHAFRIH